METAQQTILLVMDNKNDSKRNWVEEIIVHSRPMTDERGSAIRGTVMFCRAKDGQWSVVDPSPKGNSPAELADSRRKGNHGIVLAAFAFQQDAGDMEVSGGRVRFVDRPVSRGLSDMGTGAERRVETDKAADLNRFHLNDNTATRFVSAAEVKQALNDSVDSRSDLVHAEAVGIALSGRSKPAVEAQDKDAIIKRL